MNTTGDATWVLGSRVDVTSYEDACDRIQTWAESQTSCYIIAANVHVMMTGYWQPDYQTIINEAALVTPDGMPLVWVMRQLGRKQQTRVYGPDLMLAWCERAAEVGLPIYLYGGTETMLEKLITKLTQQYPQLKIAGHYAPPFRALTLAEEKMDCDRIQTSGAAVVFVALGCPKQEQWMARQQSKIKAVMIGVGAAFSFHSGDVQQAPRWMMRLGLEWLYRLLTEPRRLWRRYLINNPLFILLVSQQMLQQACKRSR
ncbi:WecB/TagA/CpsF family glycosyltransferase [Acaryochloris sp. IP29b_bin.148]|uniref:WecB/TagA/CpsF family glycosyltransferase n=1 Tax=Acaryochloris sp. IP29b_bin.148 TaxID=2969218 RepID=UPI0026345D41|nr:WecB/TagA/CpsF family glycosyltransferase [Acaryochloris sp. IP29b_bin.148]